MFDGYRSVYIVLTASFDYGYRNDSTSSDISDIYIVIIFILLFALYSVPSAPLCHVTLSTSYRHLHIIFVIVSHIPFYLRDSTFLMIYLSRSLSSQDISFRQEIEQSPELGLLILDAMQEAEIDNNSERLKKRRRITETGGDNGSALVPRQVREG